MQEDKGQEAEVRIGRRGKRQEDQHKTVRRLRRSWWLIVIGNQTAAAHRLILIRYRYLSSRAQLAGEESTRCTFTGLRFGHLCNSLVSMGYQAHCYSELPTQECRSRSGSSLVVVANYQSGVTTGTPCLEHLCYCFAPSPQLMKFGSL